MELKALLNTYFANHILGMAKADCEMQRDEYRGDREHKLKDDQKMWQAYTTSAFIDRLVEVCVETVGCEIAETFAIDGDDKMIKGQLKASLEDNPVVVGKLAVILLHLQGYQINSDLDVSLRQDSDIKAWYIVE